MAPTVRDESVHSASSISPTSYYHANRNGLSTLTTRDREPKVIREPSTPTYYAKPPLASNITVSGSAILDHVRQQDRMRAQREANTSRGSTSSLDRVGLSPSLSPSAPSSADLSYGRSRPFFGPSRAYSSSSSTSGTGRSSILEPTDVLKPVQSAYRTLAYTRTPSISDRESLYDYSGNSRSGSQSRGSYSRDSSVDRSRDVRSSGRFSRRPPESEDEENSVTISVKLKPAHSSSTGLPPLPSSSSGSYTRQPSANSYSSSRPSSSASHYSNLARSDSQTSLNNGTGSRDSGLGRLTSSLSSGGLSRFSSVDNTGSPRYSRGVGFDMRGVEKRDPSPAVLMSRVAVERDIPIVMEKEDQVESRYVVSKFPVEVDDQIVKNVPVGVAPKKLRERDPSVERGRPAVRVTRGVESYDNVVSAVPVQNGYRRQESVDRRNLITDIPVKHDYDRPESRERVIGGKAFASDSSLGSSGSEDEGVMTKRFSNSIIRNTSPPREKRVGPPTLRKTSMISVDESEKAGLIGLKNLGNTCFMNSILQCLSNTKPLRDFCLKPAELENELNTSSSQMKAFAAVLESLWKRSTSYSSTTPYAPDRFHRQVQQFAPRFSGYLYFESGVWAGLLFVRNDAGDGSVNGKPRRFKRASEVRPNQQDAQEFLRYLLEGLHEDVNRVKEKVSPEAEDIADKFSDAQKATESWKRYLKRDNSKIVDLFVGQLKSSLICESCGHCSVTYDPFWDLSLPIPGSRTGRSYGSSPSTNIDECFKLFTKEEMLEGDESPLCSRCKTRQKCRKYFTIQRFPKFLVIHLKRFSQERYRAKLSTLVEYPVDGLDLSPYAADPQARARPVYNLFAAACHSGSTHCGHYIAYCKHPVTGKWNEYNDQRVSPVKEGEVVTSEAYLLFYELAS